MSFDEIVEEWGPWAAGISAVLGILYLEHLYWTEAEEVRLLFVLLLVPVGAFAGVLAMLVVVGLLYLAFLGGVIVLSLVIIGLVITFVLWIVQLLYDTVLRTN